MSHHDEHASLFAPTVLSRTVQARDPIPQLKKVILEGNILTQDELKAIEKDVLAEVDAAVQFAEESPKPVSPLPSALDLLFTSTSAFPCSGTTCYQIAQHFGVRFASNLVALWNL